MDFLKDNERVVGFQEKYNTVFLDALAKTTISNKKIIGNNIGEYSTFVEKGEYVEVYYSKKSQDQVDLEHGRYFLNKARSKRLINRYDRIIRDHKELWMEIASKDYSKVGKKELIRSFRKYIKFLVPTLALYRSSRHEAEIEPEKVIKSILNKHFKEKEIDEKYALLAESPKTSLIEREKQSWVNLVSEGKIDDDKLNKHTNEFASFFINFLDIAAVRETLRSRYRVDSENIAQLHKEIEDKKSFLKNLPDQQNLIWEKCENHNDLIFFSKMLQNFGWYRFEIKDIWAGSEIRFLELFQAIAKSLGISLFDLMNYYLIEEVTYHLKKGTTLHEHELSRRKNCLAILVNGKKYEVLSGGQSLRLLEKMRESIKISDQITGQTGYKGIVRGIVQQVYPQTMSDVNFVKGNILVTTATQPCLVPIMSKASAIVTDFGGITSHAAIVARELKIPCVIGTKIGSRVLKDGDLVEVNANEGKVRKIK